MEVRLSEISTPIHTAVLSSFCMPACCTLFAFIIKYVDKSIKLSPIDYTMGFWFVMSLVIQIVSSE